MNFPFFRVIGYGLREKNSLTEPFIVTETPAPSFGLVTVTLTVWLTYFRGSVSCQIIVFGKLYVPIFRFGDSVHKPARILNNSLSAG